MRTVFRIYQRVESLSFAAVLLAFVAGCAIHQPERTPSPLVPAGDQFREKTSDTGSVGAGTSGDWWRSFDDSVLDQLISDALDANLDLAQFQDRIVQARARLRQAGGRLFPQVDAEGNFTSRWSDGSGIESNQREDSSALGVVFGWEIDFWGRLRSAKGARVEETEAAIDDWQAARLTLSASIAEIYFEILEQQQQLNLLNQQIGINTTLLDLTRLRFGQGLSSIVDVLQQQEQLASTRTLVPAIEARLEQLELTLDVLLGKSPGDRQRFVARTLDLPPKQFDAGVPSDLLANRPDLLASRHRVTALDYSVGEGIAERLPRFSIGGSLSAGGYPGLDTLTANAITAAVGPVFDAGIRKAEVTFRKAQLMEAIHDYSGRYLNAVREVETALLRGRKRAEGLRRLESQLSVAKRLLRETRNRYSQGLTDYLPVLAAVGTVQTLERDVLTSLRELILERVSLHRALGGPIARPGPALDPSEPKSTKSAQTTHPTMMHTPTDL